MDCYEEQDTGHAGQSQMWPLKDSDSAHPDIFPAAPGLACTCKHISLQNVLAIWELRHDCPLKLTYHLEQPIQSNLPGKMQLEISQREIETIGRTGSGWQLTDGSSEVKSVNEGSGFDAGCALTGAPRPPWTWGMGAGPEPSTKHFRSCETREVDTGAHVSDKFRRDRFEALTTPTLLLDCQTAQRGAQRGRRQGGS